MENFVLETYQLLINDKQDNTCSCSIKIINEGHIETATKKERRKIYIISTLKNEILYVGEANTSIQKRFQRGCTSFNYYIKGNKPRGGYKGYKWLDKKDNEKRHLKLYVAVFLEKYDDSEQRKNIEAIEGELVYLIRQEKGYWPKFQNEIHFYNDEEAKSIAMNILEQIF